MHNDLVVFGEDWGALPSSTQHIINHLAKSHRVIWINSIGLRQPRFTLQDVRRVWQKLRAPQAKIAKPNVQHVPQNFTVVNPKTIPAPRSWLMRKLAKFLLMRQLRPILRDQQIKHPILWISLATAVDFIGAFDECAAVYYCGDDFGALAGVDHQTVEAREQELLSKVDHVFVVSSVLRDKFSAHQHVSILPHGVDFKLFNSTTEKAPELLTLNGPVAGFYGSISQWLDQDLLYRAALARPTWHFVFVGKVEVDVSRLSALPNIHFLGPRPYYLLPSFSQHWQVSLIPHRHDGFTKACNPLKLREYMATGTPIISTRIPAVEEYAEYVRIIDDADDFIQALDVVANEKKQHDLAENIIQHDWTYRAKSVKQIIDNLTGQTGTTTKIPLVDECTQ